jgi:deoxyribodipyrimidine photo-lyase
MRTLVWFRRDLRVRDNAALHHAAKASDRGVIGVFLLSPTQWRQHDDAPCKIDFWLRNLHELKTRLDDRNIPLVVKRADHFRDAATVLTAIAKKHECDAICFNREYEINERRRDEAVEQECRRDGIQVRSFTDRVVLEPGDVLTQDDSYYGVFTPFKKRWCAIVKERAFDVLPMPARQDKLDLPSTDLAVLTSSACGFESNRIDPDRWPAGEDHAKRRLDAFVESRLGDYHNDRDCPGVNGTSTLSPYLTAGVLSPRQCLAAAMRANNDRLDTGRKGPTTWITELIWREFYQHVLVGFPRVAMHRPFKLDTLAITWKENDEHFAAWCEGRTGYPIVDAAMRQLVQTGWMHNRLRMITAMFLSKDLFLDWRRGERFFMQHLIDGDLGANNGGWQWSSSTGTDAAPYFRIFNPVTQSRRVDPDGKFLRRYLPELAELDEKSIHHPGEIPALLRQQLDYPNPIVDHRAARDHAIAAFKLAAARRR